MVRLSAATTGSATIGSGANGTVTVTADTAGRSRYYVRVVLGVGLSVAMTATQVTAINGYTTITVTLGTDVAGALDPTKNTATLVAAAVNALSGVGATASGTGATALTLAEAAKDLFGKSRKLRPAIIRAVGIGTTVDAEVIIHGSTPAANLEVYAALPKWDRSTPSTLGWVRL